VTVVAEYPGLARGLIRPGDILVCLCDEWRNPTDWFVDGVPFERIRGALWEEGDRPVTLRFERFSEDDPDEGEFLMGRAGDRTSVRGSHTR
jgi:hypothetical protein